MQLFLNQKFCSDLSPHALAAYCALRMLTLKERPMVCVSVDILCYHLFGNFGYSKHTPEYVREGLKEILDNKIVRQIDGKKNYYVLDCSSLLLPGSQEKFTIVTDQEVNKVFSIKGINNYILLKYFIALIGSFSSKTSITVGEKTKRRVVGNSAISYISKTTEISEQSIYDYNSILENAELIYVFRPTDMIPVKKQDEFKKRTNIYGRFEDKAYVEKYAKDFIIAEFGTGNTWSPDLSANERRRLSQVYNRIATSHGDKYSMDEINSVYNFVLSENKRYEELYETTGSADYLNKVRDLSVFEKYDITTEG
jgi:hypothetical protein